MNRRKFLKTSTGVLMAASTFSSQADSIFAGPDTQRRGRIKQGLWRVNFGVDSRLSLDEMCRLAAHLGVHGFDLIDAEEWLVLQQYGLRPLMIGGDYVDFKNGIIHLEHHDRIEALARPMIEKCRDNNVATMAFIAGEKQGMDEERAMDNAVAFFNRIRTQLEDSSVIAGLENVNNLYNEPGYSRPDQVCGPFTWGVEMCRRVNSPNVRMICDIYHLQIQDGNIARTIRENIDWITHFHVAGVPGRNEINSTQEINYRYIAEVIAETNYAGYVSHEWRPSPGRDPVQSIEQALNIMDV